MENPIGSVYRVYSPDSSPDPGRKGALLQPGKFRSSTGSSYTIHPVGKQHLGLPSVANRTLDLKNNVRFNKELISKQGRSCKTTKVEHYFPDIRTVLGYTCSTALHAVNSAHLSSIIKKGTSLTGRNFILSFRLLRGINSVSKAMELLQQSSNAIINTVKNIASNRKRTQAQELLNDYDPETRTLEGSGNKAGRMERLKSLLQSDNALLGRTKKQLFLDRFLEIKKIAVTAAGFVEAVVLLAARFTHIIFPVSPGVGIIASAFACIKAAINTGVHVVALDNLASAQAATKDPLLVALSGHIKQERTIQARQQLINTSINAMTVASHVGSLFTPVALAGFIVSGSLGIGSAIGMQAFDIYHKKQLGKQRSQSFDPETSPAALSLLAEKNIGIAECAFLHHLRNGTGEVLRESVVFLRSLGVTDATIKRLQLSPEQDARKLLREVLYQDKLGFKGLQLKQTGKTFMHITGISALKRKIKARSRYLAQKVRATANSHSLAETATSKYDKKVIRPGSPSFLSRTIRARQGYMLLTDNCSQYE